MEIVIQDNGFQRICQQQKYKKKDEKQKIQKKKIVKVKMNKPVYLGLPILEISKAQIHEFWYDYIKPKYQQNAKLCYMDTNSFIKILFMKILLMMLKKDFIHQILKLMDHCLQ